MLAGWHELVFKSDCKGPDRNGSVRIDRAVYELCVLGALRDGLRSKEIWGVGADCYRNPDEDLPQDFDERRERYYGALGQPMEADRFVEGLRREMEASLAMLDENVPQNPYLRLREKGKARISLSPLPAQAEPPNLDDLGIEIAGRWPMTSLLDILKEADLRLGLTDQLTTAASRQILDPDTLSLSFNPEGHGSGSVVDIGDRPGHDVSPWTPQPKPSIFCAPSGARSTGASIGEPTRSSI